MPDPSAAPPRITILASEQGFWLLEGADYLTPLLLGTGEHPRPVRLLLLEGAAALAAHLPPGRGPRDLWSINPAVVERLRRDGLLAEFRVPADPAAPRARETGA
jgi:hypothetical protein